MFIKLSVTVAFATGVLLAGIAESCAADPPPPVRFLDLLKVGQHVKVAGNGSGDPEGVQVIVLSEAEWNRLETTAVEQEAEMAKLEAELLPLRAESEKLVRQLDQLRSEITRIARSGRDRSSDEQTRETPRESVQTLIAEMRELNEESNALAAQIRPLERRQAEIRSGLPSEYETVIAVGSDYFGTRTTGGTNWYPVSRLRRIQMLEPGAGSVSQARLNPEPDTVFQRLEPRSGPEEKSTGKKKPAEPSPPSPQGKDFDFGPTAPKTLPPKEADFYFGPSQTSEPNANPPADD